MLLHLHYFKKKKIYLYVTVAGRAKKYYKIQFKIHRLQKSLREENSGHTRGKEKKSGTTLSKWPPTVTWLIDNMQIKSELQEP